MNVEIGSSVWKIKRVKNLRHGDLEAYGLTESDKKLISIEEGIQEQRWLDLHTVLHEYLHAANREYALMDCYEDLKAEERAVDILSLALTQSLKHSPQFRKYLKEKL